MNEQPNPPLAQQAAGSEGAGATASSFQILLHRFANEVMALRKEVSSDLRPELTKMAATLQSLEAYVCIGLTRQLNASLREEMAKAFDKERGRMRSAHRSRRLVGWLVPLLALGLLAVEISNDAVSTYGRQAWGSISALTSRVLGG